MAVMLAGLTVGETVAEETALCSDCVSDHAEQHTAPDAPGPREECNDNSRLVCQDGADSGVNQRVTQPFRDRSPYAMTTFHDEAAFFEAWRTGVALAGERYFGDHTHFPTTATSKWDLEPRVKSITKALGVLSSGEAVFLVALISFCDSDTGGDMLKDVGGAGLSDIAARLHEQQRRVIADLVVTDPGW